MPSHYMPILLTKKGELDGLADLDADVKARFTPMFAIHPIPYDYEHEHETSKTADQHVVGLGKKIVKAWGTGRAYLDPVFLRGEAVEPGAADPVNTVFTDAAAEGLHLVPVTTPGQLGPYTDLAAEIHRRSETGLCMRLTSNQWPINPIRAHALTTLLDALDVTPPDVDLVLDLGVEVTSALAADAVAAGLSTLPFSNEWRTVTLTGGSFPENLSNIAKHQLVRLPRSEWAVYNRARDEAQAAGTRIPDFGDYGIAHPDPNVSEIDPRFMQISAQQRYTIDDCWLVAKGELFKGRAGSSVGGEATRPLARMLASAPEFCGPDYSPGDRWIFDTAAGEGKGGTPLIWRRHGTSHHLTFVSESLATRF